MVNIPVLTMDDYGLLEPTDVGNMTIDYDPKDEFKRRNRWDSEEVGCMLNLIKENNFISRYSVTKMSSILSDLMLKKGWTRTDRQVHLKLTTLRKNFLACERQKAMNRTLKECPFFQELREIYTDINSSNGIDSEDYDSSQDECSIKFSGDHINWNKAEIQKMLSIIKSMKLKNELTLTFFSPVAVRMIAEAMQSAGFDRSTEQVKNALINLRTMYIDYKIGFDNNENPPECMFYPCLDMFWGREYKKCRLKEKRKIRSDDSWSVQETIILLTLVQDLNIAEDAFKNTEKAAEDLRQSLAENGYCRSKQQIINRLINLKTDFLNVHTSYVEIEAIKRFPFYNLYKKLFERQFTREMMRKSNFSVNRQNNSFELIDFRENIKEKSQNKNKDVYWCKKEIKLLLKTVQELTSGSYSNDSLEDEKLQKLVRVLKDSGYYKTAEQIKYKLVLLKNLYLKCNLEDSSEKDIFECPFYNELHKIFHTPVSDERYEFIQNLLAENLDLDTSKFSDHSYTNIKFGNSCTENRVNDKVTVVPNKSLETWFPVENIIDEEDISPSSTLEFNNISAVSSKEHEQVIEDAFLSILPNSCDTKIDGNCSITEDSLFLESKSIVVPEERVPQIITNVALDQEITTTDQETEIDFSRIYKYTENLDDQIPDSIISPISLPREEDRSPPNKKPRIIEDEKITLKNKFLLRPVEMNPSSLNITNTKFVRLIVANEPNKNKVNHITAHIQPLNIHTNNSVTCGISSPVEQSDILKQTSESILTKDDTDVHKSNEMVVMNMKNHYSEHFSINNNFGSIEDKIKETIKEAVQSLKEHNELMQQKHRIWMEKQFEIQRKQNEEQKTTLMNELKELRNIITVLLANKQPLINNQNR